MTRAATHTAQSYALTIVKKISSDELDTGRTVVFSGYMHGRIGAGGLLGSHEHTSLGTEILDNSRHFFQLILPDSDETELRAQE